MKLSVRRIPAVSRTFDGFLANEDLLTLIIQRIEFKYNF